MRDFELDRLRVLVDEKDTSLKQSTLQVRPNASSGQHNVQIKAPKFVSPCLVGHPLLPQPEIHWGLQHKLFRPRCFRRRCGC